MEKKLIMIVALIFIARLLFGQDRTLTGKVTSASDGQGIHGVSIVLRGTIEGTVTDFNGNYILHVPLKGGTLIYSYIGYVTQNIKIGDRNRIDVVMTVEVPKLSEVVNETEYSLRGIVSGVNIASGKATKRSQHSVFDKGAAPQEYFSGGTFNTEEYSGISENIFHGASQNPLSTFSIDVDAASYSNVRRFIQGGQRPPKDAVRIEEMINYFDYDYPQPTGYDPFSINTEISAAPWNTKHRLVHIGIQGKEIPKENLPPTNLVFLIDVSGSMSDENKLPLLKSSFKLLVEQLREQDRIAIVVYAGAAGLVLPSTSGADKKTIIEALDNLQAGGSTAGGAGINLAYAVAKENHKKNGNNRVILATDGDFNVGESSNGGMERLIEEKRKDGIYLTVLGFGMGNYKDSKMETLADKGNGNYMYIDSILEAQKALVNEFGGTLFTIAKDVKLQVEFNPAKVKAYRLIGYENRLLRNEDFNNDKKDAGELGSGHTVTALYEVIPVGVDSDFFKSDELKYQSSSVTKSASQSKEIMTVKFRYKKPEEDVSRLIVHPIIDQNIALQMTTDNFRWSASVAAFGMLLRDSEFVKDYSYEAATALAQSAQGKDKEGYRIEFIKMSKSIAFLIHN